MSNELANIPQGSTVLPSTITGNTPAEKNRTLRALNASESLAQSVRPGEVFEVADIFQVPGVRRSRNDNTPDMPCINTYFLLTDGRSLMSQSDGIARSVQMLLSDAMYPDCGRSTEKGHLSLCIAETVLPNGNTLKTVIPVD